MRAKDIIPASKPRNFVVKNQKTAGAGAHKDKKRAEKQGDVKHKQKQFEQDVEEGWKDKVAAAGLAGAMALGAGGASARVLPGADPNINRFTGKPIATQQDTGQQKIGFSTEYLQKVADGKHPRPMISVDDAKKELERRSQSVEEAGYRRDAYQRDYDNSVAGMGKRQSYAYSQDGGANDEGDDTIDAKIRADYEKKKQYEVSGKFWLKTKDTQQHISDVFVGKAAATKAALELLKQQPELKGNLLITAYGPDEKQESVSEGGSISEDSIRPKLAAALTELGFKGPFKLGQLPKWMAELQDGRFDKDTSIMIGGDDPNYDPWVAKGYDYGYAYGMETGYQTGLSAQEVFKQAKADMSSQGVAEGAVKNLMMDLRAMTDQEFQSRYKMTKAEARANLKK
jgi:hypothetical protein